MVVNKCNLVINFLVRTLTINHNAIQFLHICGSTAKRIANCVRQSEFEKAHSAFIGKFSHFGIVPGGTTKPLAEHKCFVFLVYIG